MYARHLPLTVWTSALLLLVGLLIVGSATGVVVGPTRPDPQVTHGQATALRTRAASLQSAVNADDHDRAHQWATTTRALVDQMGAGHPSLDELADDIDALADADEPATSTAARDVLDRLADLFPTRTGPEEDR